MSVTDPGDGTEPAADTRPEVYASAPPPQPGNGRNTPGRMSLVFAAVLVFIGLLQQGFVIFIPQVLNDFGLSIAALNGGLIMVAILEAILAIVAIALGWFALTRPGLPKAAAGAGTAIGAATLLGVIVTFATQLLAYAL